jgi:hypothetical protein
MEANKRYPFKGKKFEMKQVVTDQEGNRSS